MKGFDKIPPVVSKTCNNVENQKWLPESIFVDRPEPFSGGHN